MIIQEMRSRINIHSGMRLRDDIEYRKLDKSN
jgi:hypothetical protein